MFNAEAITLSARMAAFRPTWALIYLNYYDLYPPGKVVSCFKGAVPPLTNSLDFCDISAGMPKWIYGECRSLKAELLSNSQATSYN